MSFFARLWVQRLASLAEISPASYYLLALLMAYAGYAYLLLFPLLLAISITLLGYTIYLGSPLLWSLNDWLLAALLVSVAAASARICFVLYHSRPEQPAGRPLEADEFPILLNRISELVTTYGAQEIHHVKLTSHFRTEIIRTPTAGFPSKFINTLLIGLPIMSCMSPLHFKLLLARKIGHLALCNTSRSRRLLYLRHVWIMYQRHYSQSWNVDTIILRLFFSWYAPFFYLSTIPAALKEVFVQDKCMLDITPSENAAEVIATFEIKKRYLETVFWPELDASSYMTPKPEYLPFSSMNSIMSKALDSRTAQHYYETETNRTVEVESETPDLKSRLNALGYKDFTVPDSKKETAAHHFFGDGLSAIHKQLDNIWYLKNKTLWARRYHQGVEEKKRLKILREQATQALLSNTEAREYLLLIEKYMDANKALPLYKEIIKTNCMDAEVCYELGRLLLIADDVDGIDALEMSMSINEERTADCCHHIINYMVLHGNVKEAQHYRRIVLEHQVEH